MVPDVYTSFDISLPLALLSTHLRGDFQRESDSDWRWQRNYTYIERGNEVFLCFDAVLLRFASTPRTARKSIWCSTSHRMRVDWRFRLELDKERVKRPPLPKERLISLDLTKNDIPTERRWSELWHFYMSSYNADVRVVQIMIQIKNRKQKWTCSNASELMLTKKKVWHVTRVVIIT